MKVDKKKLVETCKTILSSADLNTITEKKVRRQIESELGLEDKLLDSEPYKGFVKESVNKVINDLSQKSESSRSPPRAKKTESRSTTKPSSISKNPKKVEDKSEESSKAFEDEKPLNSKARSKITKQSPAESSPISKTQAQNKVSKTYGESRTVSSSSKPTNGEEQSKKPEDVSKIDDKSSSSRPARGNFTSRSSKQTGQANKSKAMELNKEIPSEEESEPKAASTKRKLSSTKSAEANKEKQKLRSRIKSKVSISSDTDDNKSNIKSDSEEPALPPPKRRKQIKIVTSSDEDEVPSIKERVKEEKVIANSRVRVKEEKEIASSKMRVKEEKGIARVRVKEEKEIASSKMRVKEEKEIASSRLRVKQEKEIASSKVGVKEEKEIASSKVGVKEEKVIASSKVAPVKEEKEIASSKVFVKEEKVIASSKVGVKEEKGIASSKVARVKEEKVIASKMGGKEEGQTRNKIVAVEDGGFVMALENELLAQNSDIIESKDPIGLSGDDIDSDNTIKGEDDAEVYENDLTSQNKTELIVEIEQELSGSKTDSTSPKRTIDSGEDEDEDDNDLSSLEDDGPQKKKRNTGKTSAKSINNKSMNSKPTVEKDDKRIKSLKSLINKCGVRKIWAKELVNCNTDSSKIRKLKQILTDLGVEGRPTLEKCKKVKRRLELEAELRAMNADNIISDDVKETRKARASRGIFNPVGRRVSHANESSPEYDDTSSEDKNSDSE